MIEDWLKYVVEEVEKEKALKEVAEVSAREKGIAAKVVEEKVRELENARAVVKKKAIELETKLGEMEL